MRRTPTWAVAATCVMAAALLCVGAVAHLVDLVQHGLYPYGWAPTWLNLYWTSLAVLDPLAAVLLLGGRRRGADLARAIMVTDVAANWYAVYGIQHSGLLAEPGLQRLTIFALYVVVVTPFLRKHLSA
ncbi:hypothetical protein [Streptomyces sp. WMMB303]|uniref:hypothetical protein n=1 Tax=Streptomyces sp. WMMB303 TaxID=3034154 RepID=UPI0023ED6B43|nr:hypothetical protein [Streptomyces sp. WMMB303]MDF4253999.1 hypothetical protein [Streptomyces sp. WMMB303]